MSTTKTVLRQTVIKELFGGDGYIIDTPSSAPTTTAVVYSGLAGIYPDTHFAGGEVGVTISNVVQRRKILTYTGSTGTITPAVAFSSTPDNATCEVIRAGYTFSEIDNAVEQTLRMAQPFVLDDVSDQSLMIEDGRQTYTLPSGWNYIDGVYIDEQQFGSDRIANTTTYNLSRRGLRDTSDNTKLAERIYFTRPQTISEVWLYVQRVGTLTGNLTVTIETDSSDLPSGTQVGGSATVTASTVSTTPGWLRFALATPALLAANTKYWITLAGATTISASNYLNWFLNTANSYPNGLSATNNGSVWASASSLHFFRVVTPSAAWEPLHKDNWDVDKGSGLLRIYECEVPGTPLLLTGQTVMTALSAESDTTTIDPAWFTTQAVALLLRSKAAGDRAMLQQALTYQQIADQMKPTIRTRPRGRTITRP